MPTNLSVTRWALCFIAYTHLYQVTSSSGPCDTDWLEYQGHCYGFFTQHGTPGSLNNAVRFCRARGADVVTVESAEENVFVHTNLDNSKHKSRCFLGITDYREEGQFQTLRGEDLSFEQFIGTQPDNGGVSGTPENCVFLYSVTGNWIDQLCTANTRVDSYVCERAIYERSTKGLSILPGKRLDQADCQLESHTVTSPIQCAAKYLESGVALSFNVARELSSETPNCHLMTCTPVDASPLITDSNWNLYHFPEAY